MPADVTVSAPEPFPTFDTSDFSGAGTFYFDLVRLQDRADIPRGFLHRHNYYHLLWMTRARGTHWVDFEQFDVRDHTVFFLSPGQVHAWTSSVPPRGYVLNISTDFFAGMFPRADDIARFPFFHPTRGTPAIYLTQAQHGDMLPLLREIERETLERRIGRFDVVRSYLLILLTRLRRLYPAEVPGAGAEPGYSPSYSLMRRLTLLIEEHYLEYGAIRQYAEALRVSERQLNEAVKRTAGRTASQLVQERIALEAKRLLSNTDKGIAASRATSPRYPTWRRYRCCWWSIPACRPTRRANWPSMRAPTATASTMRPVEPAPRRTWPARNSIRWWTRT